MQDLLDDFDLINYKTTHDNHGVHQHTLPVMEQYAMLYYLLFLIVIVYIFI
jgi:hypothetical protein